MSLAVLLVYVGVSLFLLTRTIPGMLSKLVTYPFFVALGVGYEFGGAAFVCTLVAEVVLLWLLVYLVLKRWLR